jgi:hypothetical protein
VNELVIVSPTGITRPCEAPFPYVRAHLARSTPRLSCSPATVVYLYRTDNSSRQKTR